MRGVNEAIDDPRPPLDRLTPEDLPRLAIFIGAYLRKGPEAGNASVQEAAWNYAAEAELDELQELADDWRVLRAAAREAPLETIRRALRERFDSEWQPLTFQELDAVGAELERAIQE